MICYQAQHPWYLLYAAQIQHVLTLTQSNRKKMTKDQFIRNNRGIDNGDDLPANLLEQIYNRIQAKEFAPDPDNTTVVRDICMCVCDEYLYYHISA